MLDLIGISTYPLFVSSNIPVIHHIGFVTPPLSPQPLLESSNYHIVAASAANL